MATTIKIMGSDEVHVREGPDQVTDAVNAALGGPVKLTMTTNGRAVFVMTTAIASWSEQPAAAGSGSRIEQL